MAGLEPDDGFRGPAASSRWGTLAIVVVLHVLAVAGLIRAFAPDAPAELAERATALVSVTFSTPPPPPPPPEPVPREEPSVQPEEGAAAPEAPQAVPRPIAAPVPRMEFPPPVVVPPAASPGTANTSGAGERGTGTGAGGEGSGTGSGRGGSGQGGIAVTAPVKVAGEINDARDYPVPAGGREIRRGHHVIVHMTVGVDGRARNCRVVEPSPDPEADRITCRLAQERFRFRPARDAQGEPVEAPYGWRQDWF